MTLNLAVLASGRGSNFQAIAQAIASKQLDAKISCLISNNPQADALTIAQQHQISCHTLPHQNLKNDEHENQILQILRTYPVDLIVLAGYMRIVGDHLLKSFANRIVNIHPSLLPAFPGLHAQQQAVAHGVKISGCTVHFVDAGCDTGPIIAQVAVPVLDDDDEKKLSERILLEEHKLYVKVLQAFSKNKIKLVGRKVYLECHHEAKL